MGEDDDRVRDGQGRRGVQPPQQLEHGQPVRRHGRRPEPSRARRRGDGLPALPAEGGRVGQRPHPPQRDHPTCAARRLRWILGDQHRGAHRLPAAVPPGRGVRQQGRHAVDLHHDPRPRRAGRLPRRPGLHGEPGQPCRASCRSTTRTRTSMPPAHRATATPSCWSASPPTWRSARQAARTLSPRARRAGRRHRRSRVRGCRAPSSGCPWPRVAGRTPARRGGRSRSTSILVSGSAGSG